MATPQPAVTPQAVMSLVSKLGDADPDYRFMSLNDLLQHLNGAKLNFLHHDYNVAARTVDSIIKALDDQNGEVQNLAVKCLAPLVGRVTPAIVAPMIEKLSMLKLKNAVDNAIPSLALRTVVINLPRPVPGVAVTQEVQDAYTAISRVLIPRLVGPGPKTRTPQTGLDLPPVPEGMLQGDGQNDAESVDVLIEVVRCFGPLLNQLEIEAMLEIVIQLLESKKGSSVTKKRAVVAISMLAVYLTEEHLQSVVDRITTDLASDSINPVTRRLYISILGSMARSISARFAPHIDAAAPMVLSALSEAELEEHLEKVSDGDDVGQEFNDVRESALVALESFLASCPQETKPFTDDMIASCLRYLKYDPNYAVDDDEDEDMEDDDDEQDDDDEFDEDDGFEDDDDDASWKVRRSAAKTLYSLIATRGSGDLLENGVLYSKAAPPLIKRIDEREENVRLEVISALGLLVRKTGEGLHTSELSLDGAEPDSIGQAPVSRKRRRQSSAAATASEPAGVVSPKLDKIPQTGPQADLARLTPSIVKAAAKHLKGKTVPTKQAVISLLDDMVSVQRGGLAEHLGDILSPVLDAISSTASGTIASLGAAGGSASATPATLKIAALQLIGDVSKTHPSALLQPYMAKMATSVAGAVYDKFYKISVEAVRTAEELVRTMTPPRAKNAGTDQLAEFTKLYDVLIDRSAANDADVEVRQRAIHAVGIVVSRTSSGEGTQLLSPEKRAAALGLLRDRLKNETTRLAAVRAIDAVAASSHSQEQLDKEWVQDVTTELAAQLRKSNRALRGSSIMALKHIALSPASKDQLEPATIEALVSSLMPSFTNNDTHLLGPALVILTSLLPGNPELVLPQDMIAALCSLLKTPFAGLVLDQLIDLVSSAGKTSVSDQLMKGLLTEVSVLGDPPVVGKIIGTLLVAGGDSSVVTLDSFVKELDTSTKLGDEARISLALAVLGEAGKGLGASSPLSPDIFLGQFHDEPDKVSLSAALALGRAGSGNVGKYLPVILETMDKGGHTQYLLIQSLKEVLQSIPAMSAELEGYAPQIWAKLRDASNGADNKVVCAECTGRLVILSPGEFMPQLRELLSADSQAVRGMAVQAIRYSLPESDETFDATLRNVLVDMLLVMLQDQDMEIRRLAMTTLNSATHNKPDLILPQLGQLVPFVLSESVVKPELVREVKLGPFTHTVDDGLEVRKSAYETLYALMETAFSRISNIDFYDRVVAGLKDDNDIRQLCNLMITKLMVIDPDETARRLDSIAEAYRAVLSVKLKENAVKQEIEKQEEANKSVLRVTLLLGDRMKALTGSAGVASVGGGAEAGAATWQAYWEWVNKDFDKQLRGLREETRDLQTTM